ncbi:MAG: transketolase [Coriobacteriaceae bacterium]|jgi:transketolase|nr:transketolase [Coriobacteriaceae bacterium]
MDVACVREKAREVRKDILRMIAQAGSGHPGGSLSAADILATLYFGGVLRVDPLAPKAKDRDYFILAKGHAAPALYAVLAHAGFFPPEELGTLRQMGSRLQGHPDSKLLDCVEVSTGSLGQGLSIACGLACGLRLDGLPNRVFTLLGDGECQEGQVWEAAGFAAQQRLGSLIAIIDLNGLQIDGPCPEICEASSLAERFGAFGWDVHTVDGHDVAALHACLSTVREAGGEKPHLVAATTVKGKGVSFMEGQASWHGKAPDAQQLAKALEELDEKEAHHA